MTIELTKGTKTINLVKGDSVINLVKPDTVYEIEYNPGEIILQKNDKLVNLTQQTKKKLVVELLNNNASLPDISIQKNDHAINFTRQEIYNELIQQLHLLQTVRSEPTIELIVDACVQQSLSENRYINCYCSAAEAVGDSVYISGSKIGLYYQVRKTDITDYTKMPHWGFVIEKKSPTECVVQWLGTIRDIFTSLIPGRIYFLNYDSRPIATPPALTTDHFAQKVGLALDTSVLLLLLDCNLILRHNI